MIALILNSIEKRELCFWKSLLLVQKKYNLCVPLHCIDFTKVC